MTASTNGMLGVSLTQVFESLQRLQDDPDCLAYERQMYNHSPPAYQSAATTQPPSLSQHPKYLSQAEIEMQRRSERLKAIPYNQFDYQWRREHDRILEQIRRRWERRKPTLPYRMGVDLVENAKENVKNRWIEQGIWNDEWNAQGPGAHWKHEKIPEPLPEPGPPIMSLFGPIIDSRPRQSKEEYEEVLLAHQRDTAVSRPYHQFVYQISKEREWIEDELNHGDFDIDAKAYQDVKSSWIKQGIWDPRWGDMPGMTWIHEEPDPGPAETQNDHAAVLADNNPPHATEDHRQPPDPAPITQPFGFPSPVIHEGRHK